MFSGKTVAIVVGAGSGDRFGRLKQLDLLCGKSVLQRSLSSASAACDVAMAVVPESLVETLASELGTIDLDNSVSIFFTAGGNTRAESVRCGLNALGGITGDSIKDSIIVVHDAARPLASQEIFRRVIDAVKDGADAAAPATEMTDTIRHIETGSVDRSLLRAVQTPQAFKAEMLKAAHATKPEATDDATLVEAIGGKVVLVEGDPNNIKITHPQDLAVAEILCAH